MLVLSKQITSSYLPLSAVLVQRRHLSGDRRQRSGSALSATALRPAAIRWRPRSGSKTWRSSRSATGRECGQGRRAFAGRSCAPFADHPLVGEVRGVGLIAAVELVADKASKADSIRRARSAATLFERAHQHGIIIRNVQERRDLPAADHYDGEIDDLVRRFGRALADTQSWVTAGMPGA